MTTTDELLERIDELEAEQAQLRKQLEQIQSQYQQVTGMFEQFRTGTISRRAFLTSVTALAGVGFAAGSASAAPDWSNTTGYAGTQAQPLIEANASTVNSELVNTESATINGHPEQDPTKLIDYRLIQSDQINETFTLPNLNVKSVYYKIEILTFRDNESSANNPVTLTLNGVSDGSYTETLKDEAGNFTNSSGVNQFTLIEPTAGASFDEKVAEFTLSVGELNDRVGIWGDGAHPNRQEGKILDNGGIGSAYDTSNPDITVSTSSSDGSTQRLQIAVWEFQQRSAI